MSVRTLHGLAAPILRAHVPSASVDMVYADPPFGNRQVWKGAAGSFDDNWAWDDAARASWAAFVTACPAGEAILAAMAPDPRDRAYLAFMGEMLVELRRVLRLTGTLWLHHDDTMGAQLRILCDVVFGPGEALGVLIWKRTSHHHATKSFGRIHDSIAVYGRSRAAQFRLARNARGNGISSLVHGDPLERVGVGGFLDHSLNNRAKERVGYPTQKPVSLLVQLIRCATLPGDLVLDPTCGSGTTLVAAASLGRSAIGIDRSADAIAATEARLGDRLPVQRDMFEVAA